MGIHAKQSGELQHATEMAGLVPQAKQPQLAAASGEALMKDHQLGEGGGAHPPYRGQVEYQARRSRLDQRVDGQMQAAGPIRLAHVNDAQARRRRFRVTAQTHDPM